MRWAACLVVLVGLTGCAEGPVERTRRVGERTRSTGCTSESAEVPVSITFSSAELCVAQVKEAAQAGARWRIVKAPRAGLAPICTLSHQGQTVEIRAAVPYGGEEGTLCFDFRAKGWKE